jgi:LPS export ABC transporter protein LptC
MLGAVPDIAGNMDLPPLRTQGLVRRIVLAASLVAAGIAAAVYLGYRQLAPIPELAVSPKAGPEEMVVEGVHQSATREGRTEWSLDAATAQYRLTEKKVLLNEMSVTFFTQNEQKVYLTARQGTVMTDSQDMEANGNVVIYNDLYRLETETISYAHGPRMITSDLPVKIRGPAGELLADSFAMDLNANRLVMKGHVQGILAASQTP